jgi:transposase-like protein
MAKANPRSQTKPRTAALTVLEGDASHTSPHGRRYSPAEKEAAYTVWKAASRSLSKASTTMGIARNTLVDWASRADREDQEAGDLLKDTYWSIISGQVIPSVLTAVEIRDNATASNKDRLNAAQWLAGLAGVLPADKPVERSEPGTDKLYGGRPLHELSDEELLALEGL